MDAFLHGTSPLPARRSALRERWWGRVRGDGTLDKARRWRSRTAGRRSGSPSRRRKAELPPGLAALGAEDRFRLRWIQRQSRREPGPADVAALRTLVDARAGLALFPA